MDLLTKFYPPHLRILKLLNVFFIKEIYMLLVSHPSIVLYNIQYTLKMHFLFMHYTFCLVWYIDAFNLFLNPILWIVNGFNMAFLLGICPGCWNITKTIPRSLCQACGSGSGCFGRIKAFGYKIPVKPYFSIQYLLTKVIPK